MSGTSRWRLATGLSCWMATEGSGGMFVASCARKNVIKNQSAKRPDGSSQRRSKGKVVASTCASRTCCSRLTSQLSGRNGSSGRASRLKKKSQKKEATVAMGERSGRVGAEGQKTSCRWLYTMG